MYTKKHGRRTQKLNKEKCDRGPLLFAYIAKKRLRDPMKTANFPKLENKTEKEFFAAVHSKCFVTM